MGWRRVAYKTIPKASTELSMIWPAGPTRPIVETFLAAARRDVSA